MINEERIKIMAKMSMLEESKGRELLDIGTYYRSDYISVFMIKTLLATTTAFVLLFGLWAVYQWDFFMKNMNKLDLIFLGKEILICFICYSIIFQIIAYGVYTSRYRRAKKQLKSLKEEVQKLSDLYKTEVAENRE